MWLDRRWRDLGYAARSLRRTPGFTAIVALTLAVGVGASTAMFSIVYGILLRPLPYADANRLVLIQREEDLTGAHRPVPAFFSSAAERDAWSARLRSFDSISFYSIEVASLASGDGNDVIESAVVSPAFFSTLGPSLTAGRALASADDSVPSVVVSERLARKLFGSSTGAIGASVTLSSQAMTVVGVAGPGLQFPDPRTDVWMPAGFVRTVNPRCCGFRMLARLRPGVTTAVASAEVDTLAKTSGVGSLSAAHSHAAAAGMRDQLVGSVRPALLMLLAAVALLLLVASSNIVNLVLAREVTRAREAAIRSALGASRGRLVWQALMEGVVLAAGGAALSIALATSIVSIVTWWQPPGLPRLDAVRVDAIVLMFCAALALAAALGAVGLPALKATKTADVLKSGATGSSAGPAGRRARSALCAMQLALSLVLLVGASLLGRSLVRLMRTDLGVTTDHVLTASLNLAFARRPTDAEAIQRVGRILDQVQRVPGVRIAGVGTALPPAASRLHLTLRRGGDAVDYQASGVAATPGYFQALDMRLVRGRLFTPDDDLNHPPVMILSVDTARRFFGDGDPIGRTMKLPLMRDGRNGSEEMTLVGVIANVKYSGLDAAADDAVYRPFAQQTWVAPYLVVRTSVPPETLMATIRRQLAAADPNAVVTDVRPLDSVVSSAAAQPRFRTGLLATIAGLAVLIGAIGLYGVVAYSVSQRTREIGIRMALGARGTDVLAMILREGLGLVAVGMTAGLVAAVAVTRIFRGLLYGIAPTDITSFALACSGLLGVAAVATYLPARRATAVDPMVALRQQ